MFNVRATIKCSREESTEEMTGLIAVDKVQKIINLHINCDGDGI